jgi:hypothetical protein
MFFRIKHIQDVVGFLKQIFLFLAFFLLVG